MDTAKPGRFKENVIDVCPFMASAVVSDVGTFVASAIMSSEDSSSKSALPSVLRL